MDKAERTAMGERAVEAVARALCEAEGVDPSDNSSWLTDEPLWTEYRDQARSAILAYEAAKAAPMSTSGTFRAASDNGKRWRIVPDDGDWEMVVVGHVTARQAEAICNRIAIATSRLESLEALFAEQAGELERAAKALAPFANCIFNDNGDITVTFRSFTADELTAAYFARKRADRALAAEAALAKAGD